MFNLYCKFINNTSENHFIGALKMENHSSIIDIDYRFKLFLIIQINGKVNL